MARSIGRYEILEELGRGGMATVYRAFDPKLERDVALKLLDQQLSTDPTFVARFEREAKTVAGLEHSAIVSLYDYGEADGWLYLVMRYMKGGSLKELIAKGPLTTRQAYGVVRRIGSALDKAHGEGIVHRDLKPGNILLDEEQESYLSDFGIVKVATGESEYLTQTGQTLGTFAYMSPEQVMGREVDGRSDIYALGLVLYEMMTGKHPYGDSATSSGAMAVAHTQQPVPDVRQANPAAPAALNEVIQKTMAKNRDERYATCREMALAMYEALTRKPEAAAAAGERQSPAELPPTPMPARTTPPATAPVETSPTAQEPPASKPPQQQPAPKPTQQPVRRQPQRQPAGPAKAARASAAAQELPSASPDQPPPGRKVPLLVWLFAGLIGVVLLGVAAFLIFDIGGPSEEEQTRQAEAEATRQAEEATRLAEMEQPPAIQVATGGADGTVRLWDLSAGEELGVLRGHQAGVRAVAFSPDGMQLATGSVDGTVRLWNATTGDLINTLSSKGERVWSLAYNPNGTQLAAGSDEGVQLWNPNTGAEIAFLSGHQAAVRSVTFSPDGAQLASSSVDGTARLWNIATLSEEMILRPTDDWVMSVAYSPNGDQLATGSTDGTFALWDPETGKQIDFFSEHGDLVMSVAFSPVGPVQMPLATGSWDGTVKLWNLTTGQQMAVMNQGLGKVNSLLYSPDGEFLVIGSENGTVQLWDVATAQPVMSLNGQQGEVNSVAYWPAGN